MNSGDDRNKSEVGPATSGKRGIPGGESGQPELEPE